MKTRSIFCMFFLAAAIFISGCSDRISQSLEYSYPTWTSDNKILAVKSVTNSKFNTINTKVGEDFYQYLAIFDQTGANEVEYTEISNDRPFANLVYNPAKTLVSYLTQIVSDHANCITIRSVPTIDAYTGPETIQLDLNNITSYDWDPTGLRIVFCNTSGEIHIASIDGFTDTAIATVEAQEVAWQAGTRIAYTATSGTGNKLFVINSDGTGKVDTGALNLSYLQISKAANNLIYAKKGATYEKIDITTPASPVETVEISSFDVPAPQLSPSGDKVVYYQNGLYLYDLTTKQATKIK